MSLRDRIALYYVFATGLLATAVFLILYVVMYRTVYGHLDEDLDAELAEVYHGIVVLSSDIVFANPGEWSEKEHAQVEVNPVFLQIVDSSGALLRKTPSLRDTLLAFHPDLAAKSFFDASFLKAPVRQVQMPIPNQSGRTLGYMLVAVPRREADVILANLRTVLYAAFPVVLMFVFAVSRFIAGRSIAPIERVTETAERITSRTLDERIALPSTRDELHRLGSTINGLLDRLQEALLRERQFTADASHELHTPLAALKGTMEVLLRKPRTRERYVSQIAYCVSEVDRLSHLVDQLLLLARYDSGTTRPVLRDVDLRERVAPLLARMAPALDEARMMVTLHGDERVTAKADPVMLDMILENLISNSLKYSPPGSPLEIAFVRINDGAECRITDHGAGMSAEHLPRIFDRFYRVDASRNADVRGTGLGLAIVKRLAELQDLSLHVTSELDRGTSVSVIFPGSMPAAPPKGNLSQA